MCLHIWITSGVILYNSETDYILHSYSISKNNQKIRTHTKRGGGGWIFFAILNLKIFNIVQKLPRLHNFKCLYLKNCSTHFIRYLLTFNLMCHRTIMRNSNFKSPFSNFLFQNSKNRNFLFFFFFVKKKGYMYIYCFYTNRKCVCSSFAVN